MITKTGIEYSENSDLSNSSTIEENGTVNSINIPSWETGVDLYCQAYVIEDGERVNSEIEHYLPQNYFYLKNEYAGQNTITFTSNNNARNLRYSKDKLHWTTVNATTTVVMDESDKVYLKGFLSSYQFDSWFSIDCSEIYSIGGNIKTVDNDFSNPNNLGCIKNVFTGSTTLVDASEVDMSSILSIHQGGMENTFKGCTNLRKAPNMGNVQSLVTYRAMYCAFAETAIETIDLHSLTFVCDSGLYRAFYNCSNLHTVNMDNITTLGTNGLADNHLAYTFRGTNITKGIDLSHLTTTFTSGGWLGIFEGMYSDCSNISEATVCLNYNDHMGMTGWLYNAGTNVSGTKTVYCPTGVTITTDSDSGIPTGWTRVDY